MSFSDPHLRRIVPGILYLDTIELLDLYREAEVTLAQAIAAEVRDQVGRAQVGEEDLIEAARSCLAVQALVERYRLDAVTVRGWPELSRHGFSLPLACSRLGDEGTPRIQKADLPSTVLALALTRISSQPTVLGELVHVNPDKDVAIFAHVCYNDIYYVYHH